MAKSLFKNYSFSFDKNEKKILINFCKTILKQMESDDRFYNDIRSFKSIMDKLNSSEEEIKLTKDERTKLVLHLNENVKHMQKQIQKSGFIKRWLYKSAYNQYNLLLQTHFENQ